MKRMYKVSYGQQHIGLVASEPETVVEQARELATNVLTNWGKLPFVVDPTLVRYDDSEHNKFKHMMS